MKKNYQTNEMVICSVGKIKPTKFESLIRKHFELMDENVSERNRIPFNGYIPQNIEVEKDTFQSHCVIGAEAYKLTNELRLPMVLLNNILGGSSMNSRLNMALRERNGLAYNVEANYSSYTDTGVFMIYFGTERNNLYKAIDLVESEFRILRAKKLGPKILAKSKKQLIGQLAIANENREDLMLTIGRSYLYFNKVDRLQDVFQKIENITANDLHKISNEILAKNNLSKLIFL
jgi:predicted Zn-dependent peptidase